MTGLWLANLLAYSLQVAILTALAEMFALIVRLRSPGAMLRYWQMVLAACLLLPLIEPWRPVTRAVPAGFSIRVASGALLAGHGLAASPLWPTVTAVVIGAGILIRLFWLAAGLWRLRGRRRRARPLKPLPLWLAQLEETIGVQPGVYVCGDVAGPATFGLRAPSLLLPSRWLELDRNQQSAIACHELLHVQRRDWWSHVAEEIVRAVFWFHPAIWWLIAEIRLAREQVVDRLVVRFTGARRPYVEALLAFADTTGDWRMACAPAFSRRHQLTRSVSLILQEVSMSKFRLITSLAGITLCLAVAGAYVAWSIPLQRGASAPASGVVGGVIGGVITGVPGAVAGGVIGGVPGGIVGGIPGGIPGAPAQAVAARPQDPRIYRVDENGVVAPKVLHKTDPAYTQEARDAKIEGTVVLQLEVHPDGHAHNARIEHSLDPGLDRSALDALSSWRFQPATKDGDPVAVSATIEINFRLN